jgi:hypothetical protein
MRLQVRIPEIKGLAALWARAPEIVGEEMLAAVRQADLYLQGELQQKLPRGAGAITGGAGLAGSIFTEEQRAADRVVGMVASPLAYAEFVELGTRPHFPPTRPIEDWVQAKLGIDDPKERASVAFLIARKISVEGTKADGTWQRVADAATPAVEAALAAGIERALDRLGAPQ